MKNDDVISGEVLTIAQCFTPYKDDVIHLPGHS